MNAQQEKAGADDSQSSPSIVSLLVDYANGVTKSFRNLPAVGVENVLDLLDEARSAGPGLQVEFDVSFQDRGGRDVMHVVSIDGVAAASEDQQWLLWVNEKHITKGIRAPGQFAKFGEPAVQAGDTVTFKLVTEEKDD